VEGGGVTPEIAYWIFCSFAGLFGLAFGSFLNVCIYRMPLDRSVVWPGSACPACGEAIKAYDNVPVLAWFWLGGRCRACRARVSGQYPAVEALFGVLSMLLFRRLMPDLGDLDLAHFAAYAWYLWLLFALVGLTFIDLQRHIIPYPFSIYSVPVAVGGAALLGWLGYGDSPTWQASVVGAAIGGGFLALVALVYKLVRHDEGMGGGDAQLLALLGGYFGVYPGVLYILMIGATFGAVIGSVLLLVRRKGFRTRIPFGPFLALGAVVWLFFGEQLFRILTPWAT
jgi:leader peptidase (prepilin peptidase)/N-methyltransferase